jgi:flagellar hook-basal body complex protein FliE
MVNGIGGSGAGRTAIDAALRAMRERSRELGTPPDSSIGGLEVQGGTRPGGFAEALKNGVNSVEEEITKANEVQIGALEGRLDLHEVAAQLKESEITFQFALQVRNKLMDAYREVMRMSV